MQICKKCGKLVHKPPAEYELLEGMHWLCYHFEYEHSGDPDTYCNDPSCPLWHIEVYKEALRKAGFSPERLIEEALDHRHNSNEYNAEDSDA